MMPPLEIIDGIKLFVYDETGGKHHKAHFHAYYAEFSAEFYMDGALKKGKFPNSQTKKVLDWLSSGGRDKAVNKWKELNENEN